MILATVHRWISLLLLGSERAKQLDIDTLLLPARRGSARAEAKPRQADKPDRFYLFERFSGMKKAALEKFVPRCDILFSLKSIKRAGRWGRLYENITQTIHYEKISYTATQKYKKHQRFFRLD